VDRDQRRHRLAVDLLDSTLALRSTVRSICRRGPCSGRELLESLAETPRTLCELGCHLRYRLVRTGLHDLRLADRVLRAVEHAVEFRRELEDVFGLERRRERDGQRGAELALAVVGSVFALP